MEAFAVAGVHVNPLRHEVPGVEPADRVKAQESLAIDVAHEKADLVHVRRHEHTYRLVVWNTAARMANTDCVPDCIHVQVVHQWTHRIEDHGADRFLPGRHSRCLGQGLEEVEVQ